MAANAIVNATGLDGATGFTVTGGALYVDETTRGAEGRIVLGANASGAGAVSIFQDVAVSAGDDVEVFAHVAGVGLSSAPGLSVQFRNGGGVVSTAAVPIRRAGRGSPARGIPGTFDLHRARLVVPAGATTARLLATGTASGAGSRLLLLKPFLAAGDLAAPSMGFQAGPHANIDLAEIPAWPADLPLPEPDDFSTEPIPLRKAFAGDDGVPTTRRVAEGSRAFLSASLALDMAQRDALESFWRANHEQFFFTRYDTQEVCVAEWAADGDPRDAGAKVGARRTAFKVLLRVA